FPDWLAQLPGVGLVADPSTQASAKVGASLNQLRSMASTEPAALHRVLDPLLGSTSASLQLVQALAEGALPTTVREAVVARAAQSDQGEVRELFERFLPEERRVKRLGNVIKPEQILALPGDAGRGR